MENHVRTAPLPPDDTAVVPLRLLLFIGLEPFADQPCASSSSRKRQRDRFLTSSMTCQWFVRAFGFLFSEGYTVCGANLL